MRRYNCPCCNYKTLTQRPSGTFEVCPVCYWEDDNVQFNNPDYGGGANVVSLNQARANFKKFGVSDSTFKNSVRPPFSNEY